MGMWTGLNWLTLPTGECVDWIILAHSHFVPGISGVRIGLNWLTVTAYLEQRRHHVFQEAQSENYLTDTCLSYLTISAVAGLFIAWN
jgi:hypothetical protein